RAQMEHRRRGNGGPLRGTPRRAGRPRAEARAVRVGAVEPARPDAGAAGQAHDLCVAMPLNPDLGGQDYDEFQEEFADKIIETWARYCPNMTRRNVIARRIYTAREYACELINMRSGDIFMGAFNAEQVMYNHFGYRSPIANLYNAGSAGHPGGAISGGAGYI